jgi:hypothetical protein
MELLHRYVGVENLLKQMAVIKGHLYSVNLTLLQPVFGNTLTLNLTMNAGNGKVPEQQPSMA